MRLNLRKYSLFLLEKVRSWVRHNIKDYVTGDTYARKEANGKDEFFQFIIGKAKVLSENTITLEAEGDPSVFNMSLRVMRAADGSMMKLVKYTLTGEETTTEASTVDLIHNHELNAQTVGNNIVRLKQGTKMAAASGVTTVATPNTIIGITYNDGEYFAAVGAKGNGTIVGFDTNGRIVESIKVVIVDSNNQEVSLDS